MDGDIYYENSILSTYHDDFPKYSSRIRADLLQKVFVSVPSMLGRKLIYTHLVEGEKSRGLSAAYDLLRLARVVAKVRHVPARPSDSLCDCKPRDAHPSRITEEWQMGWGRWD